MYIQCWPAELQQLDLEERRRLLKSCGLSSGEVEEVETMLSGGWVWGARVGAWLRCGEIAVGRVLVVCVVLSGGFAPHVCFQAVHGGGDRCLECHRQGTRGERPERLLASGPHTCPNRTPTPPLTPLPAAMPSVWVSAQCVVEADEVRTSVRVCLSVNGVLAG